MAEISAQQAQALLEKATPGPWKVCPGSKFGVVRTDDDRLVAVPNESEAALIAAAPDLAQTVITLTERMAAVLALCEAADGGTTPGDCWVYCARIRDALGGPL